MATDQENLRRIGGYQSHHSLVELWESIQSADTPEWDSGKAFEYLVLRGFELEGAKVRYPYSVRWNSDSNDDSQVEQIDGVIYAEGVHCLCESKDYTKKKVNVDPIAKLRNQLLRRPSSAIGCVFSSSGFTEPAIYLARFVSPQTILLWNQSEIEFALKEKCFIRGLVAKFRNAIEHGLQDIDLRILISSRL